MGKKSNLVIPSPSNLLIQVCGSFVSSVLNLGPTDPDLQYGKLWGDGEASIILIPVPVSLWGRST